MKIFLVGATGKSGAWILKAALNRGHSVTALVREPLHRIQLSHPSLSIVAGDLNTIEKLDQIVSGHEIIISALNSESVESGTTKIIRAGESVHVLRFIGIAGGGILQLTENSLRRERPNYPAIFLKSSEGHLKAWKSLEKSKMQWTLLCTPDLKNAPANGSAHAREDYMPEGSNAVHLGDVANYILKIAEENIHIRKRVGFTGK